MITRLGSVPVFVSDPERALAFFRDKLKFEVVIDQQYGPAFRWIAMARRRGETELVLFHPVKAVAGDRVEELRERIGIWTGVVFLTDDIERDYRELSDRGVEFTLPPRLQPWGGHEAQFTDPDGNGFHLVQRPANT